MRITPGRFRLLFGALLVSLATLVALLNIRATEPTDIVAPLTIEQKVARSGNHYTIIHKNKAQIALVDKMPGRKDKKVLLSIAAAFTNTKNDQVDGVYVVNGAVHHADKVNHNLGGAMAIRGNKARIFPTQYGAIFTPEYLDKFKEKGAHLFQQLQIVVNGKAESFKDTKLFQRRAIVLDRAGNVTVIESKAAITLAMFSKDIVELGGFNAIYTDMGAWDEGWYRDAEGVPITIGKDRSQTARQSNWIVFTTN